MTTAQRDKYRAKLQELARRLNEEVNDLHEESSQEWQGQESDSYPATTRVVDELPQVKTESEIVLHLLDNQQQILANVRAALRRLDNGTFGACECCGRPIDSQRLKALPYAAHCVLCPKS